MRGRGIGMRIASLTVAGAVLLSPRIGVAAGPLPRPEVETIENGLRVAVFTDPRLPIVEIQMLVPAGVAAEPADQSGVANLTALALRSGTTSRTTAAFGADLERLGGTLSGIAGRDFASVSATFLSRDLESGLELVADAVTHPIFDQEDVDRLKRQTANGLMQADQSPSVTADERIWQLAFEGHPYGHPAAGTPESVARLTVDQIRAFYHEHYRPEGAVLVVAGDAKPPQVMSAVREWFGTWSGRAPVAGPLLAPAAPKTPRIVLVDRPALARAEIRLGAPSAPRNAPDYLPLALANHCLGGAAWSWLSRGAGARPAEGARSSVTPLSGTGLFTLAASAAPESAGAAVVRLRERVAAFLAATPTDDEIGRARGYFQRVYPLQFETLAARAAQWLAADHYGLPAEFFERYHERIGAIGAQDAAAAARHWIDPSRLVVVVVGPAARIKPQLDALGPVDVLAPPTTLAGGAGAGDNAKPTPEQERRGRELFELAAAAHGGADRLKGTKDSALQGNLTLYQGGNEMKGDVRQLRREPYKMIFITNFNGFETRQTLNGHIAWSRAGADTSQVVEADSSQVLGLRSGFNSDLVHLLVAGLDPGASAAYLGHETVLGRGADVVRLEAPDTERRRYYFDAETHRLLAIEEAAPAVVGRLSRRIYTGFKTVDGVLWPMSEERQIDGSRVMLLTVRSLALNRGVADSLFARPPALRRPMRIR
ncbi:MAG TPA: insulinase family protein [Candidatus Eisenbacteria bacterium]